MNERSFCAEGEEEEESKEKGRNNEWIADRQDLGDTVAFALMVTEGGGRGANDGRPYQRVHYGPNQSNLIN